MSLFGTTNPTGSFISGTTTGGLLTSSGLGGDGGTSGQKSSLFGGGSFAPTAVTQQQQPSTSFFGGSSPQSTSGNLFNSTATGGQQKTLGMTGTTTSMFSGQPSQSTRGTASGFGLTGFGASNLKTGTSVATTGTKRFLPGRPSLQDLVGVAPLWKSAFDQINKELSERDDHATNLKGLLKDLKTRNTAQKTLLAEKLEVSKKLTSAQNTIETEIDALQPAIQKLQRQCTLLTSQCERTINKPSSSSSSSSSLNQPLIVPQPEYLRFINDIMQRVQLIQDRAETLSRSVSLLFEELQGAAASPVSEIKTALSLLMAQYRQLKLRQLGLHEELRNVIERYKTKYQLGPDLDKYLQEESFEKTASPFSVDRKLSQTLSGH